MSLLITRERATLSSALKVMKRSELQSLCETHDIPNPNRTKAALEAALLEHCCNDHTGRAINLYKCDAKNNNAPLTASTTIRPALLRTSQSARPASVQAAQSTDYKRLEQMQATLDLLLSRPTLTEEHITQIVERRLDQYREEVRTALNELHEIYRSSFAQIQSSLETVDGWRVETTETFRRIDDWAKEVEQRILGQPRRSLSALPKHPIMDQPRQRLSSTPAARQVAVAAPSLPPIPNASKRVRLSDASDFSLATIPEVLASPDAQSDSAEQQPSSAAKSDKVCTSPDQPKGSPSLPAYVSATSPSPSGMKSVRETVEAAVSTASLPAKSITASQSYTEATPAAAKTLFGTERSVDERFGEGLDLEDVSSLLSVAPLSTWNENSPAWFKPSIQS